ncbi:MAG: hypothetical protein HRU21_12490 [Pseudomonadales bacterium]|nr:hypothetical protein [Pseudomonadales bacterium]
MSSTNTVLKDFFSSPWIRVANFFLMVCISLVGALLLRAESEVKSNIESNEKSIESLEGRVDTLEDSAIANGIKLTYIKEAIDEMKSDLKDIKNR